MRVPVIFIAVILSTMSARADDFTHYVLALSWNASWCAIEGDSRNADQCDPRHELGFTLHGL
ncbi:MAG: ribonuclease T, partial [Pseudomonadota bacterium]